jgi:ribose transport system ATP-binding protein
MTGTPTRCLRPIVIDAWSPTTASGSDNLGRLRLGAQFLSSQTCWGCEKRFCRPLACAKIKTSVGGREHGDVTVAEWPVLRARSISKSYTAQRVLDAVDLDVRSAEILALMGENGAGKSTLMRILAGATRLDSGTISFRGEPVEIRSVRQAQGLGVAMIFQELNLVPSRTVAQNIYLGREPAGRFGAVDSVALRRQTERVLGIVGSKATPDALVSELSVGQQQLIEIAKALSFDAKVLFMDEPTSSLSQDAAENLLRLMSELRSQGMAIVFTTHRLPEAFKVADRFVVLRDGKLVGTALACDARESTIVEMMVGRPLSQHYPKAKVALGDEPALEVEGLSGGIVTGVSFAVRPGEILGFAGLVGAGRTEVMRLVFGADRATAGTIRLNGEVVHIGSPDRAIAHGIGFVPEDRKRDALALGDSVRANIALAGLDKLSRQGVLNAARIDRVVLGFVERLRIKVRSLDQPVSGLSGGNQQKCVLSRWLVLSGRVLILDEPTRGIDVGAKAAVYHLIGELAQEGMAIIFISSELPEVLGLSDRVVVMARGRVMATLDRAEASPETVMRFASHAVEQQSAN